MLTVHYFRQPEFREKVTGAILEMLTHLPETQKNIFVWNHYCGYQPKEIAEILKSSPSEIESALDALNAILYQRTRSLVEEDLPLDVEMDLPAAFSRKTKVIREHSIMKSSLESNGTWQGWTEMLDRLTECVAKD